MERVEDQRQLLIHKIHEKIAPVVAFTDSKPNKCGPL